MPTPVPLFGFGLASKSPYVTAKLLTNIYAEQRPSGEKAMLVGYATPGLEAFVNFGDTPVRGALEFPKTSVAYVVHRDTLWEVNPAGLTTSRGTLLTSGGRVSIAHNGVQVMIADGTYGYIFDTGTSAFARITDADFPANPVTCCYLGRRFLASFADSGRFYWSDIDNGLAWDALNFANAETNPDPIAMVYANSGQAILLGLETTEFWANSGVADPAFVAINGSATEWGIAAPWSIAKYDNSFACLMKNRMGQVMIAQMAGYVPKKLSNVDIDSIINAYAVTSDATGYSYMLGGHPMLVMSFPTAGYTWLFDGSTGIWSALKSAGLARHRAELSFNLSSKTYVTDYENGKIYRLGADVLTDNGEPIGCEIISETVAAQGDELIAIDCLRLDMETGVGTGELDPQVSLSVSRNNGRTWGTEMFKSAGKEGAYNPPIEWRRLGTCRHFTAKIRMTDPVRRVFVRATLNPET